MPGIMPGFDSKRFVNITDVQKDDFMCGVCLGILNNPFAAKCCKQLYCYDCIREWLSCSTTCPYDRSLMHISDLKRSDTVADQMQDLVIHCEYEPYGCDHTMPLKDLSQHMNNCIYDPERKCGTCGLTMGDINKHNCIELLITEKERYRRENLKLQSKLQTYKEQMFEDERHCWDDPLWCM
ncbi:E3 ubiquitin-protein ligase NRDP1-like [Oppia nitens]|uniref:E3 ubiquitin-protein ligase NRDP1-like n=1 Tax=Oppia nitens TaxID=1686743 RepID=UPI0023DA47FC|nr:E3 ubiquitin-protein ligase NRDP1-like [Oppia nitens]